MEKQIIWCRMKFKPIKSRSLSLRKVNQNMNFKVGGQRIPIVSKEPVKSFERWLDESLKDINQAKNIQNITRRSL